MAVTAQARPLNVDATIVELKKLYGDRVSTAHAVREQHGKDISFHEAHLPDAVVFAAGAGPGSGAARKETVDRAAAVLLADAAIEAGVRRYLMISAMGADRGASDEATDPVFAAYLRAKAAADEDALARAELQTTVVRPGHLTDDAGAGRVHLAPSTGRGNVPRQDVAAVLVAVLDAPETAGHTFELIGGDTPIADAVAAVGRS